MRTTQMSSGTFESPMAESFGRTAESSTSDLAVNDQEHGDTQRSLQQASMALEVAYNRIRQVRRNLRELSDSLPSTDSIPRFPTRNSSEIEPGHDALLLAGDGTHSGDELLTELHPSTNHILSQIPPVANPPDDEPLTSGDGQDANEDGMLDLNYSIYLQPFFTPSTLHTRARREFSSDMQYLRRRGVDYDAGTTLRGLRVAAREAQGQELRQRNAEYAEINNLPREAPHPAVQSFTGISHRVERHGHLASRTFDALGGRAVANYPPSAAAPPSWRSADRRWRMLPDARVSRRPVQDVAPDRFHTVLNAPHSNGPRNVLRLPIDTESRPMISPLTNEQDRRFLERMQSDSRDSLIDWSEEQFLSTLFLGREGDSEQSRESQPVASQPNPETIRITRTTNTAVSPSERSPRRGWARLDADGNEISPDEEEELERSRTAYRIQALQRSRLNSSQDNADNALIGAIGQNHSSQRNVYGSVLDSTMRIQGENQHTHNSMGGDMSPLYIDPLPMPLASMNSIENKSNTEGRHPDIFVPKHACLAGR